MGSNNSYAEDPSVLSPFSPKDFRSVMRAVPSTVTIIAAGPPGRRNGLTVTSVCSVSVEPPTILVCVNREATAHDEILDHGFFSISFLSSTQEAIANVFSGATGQVGEQRFSSQDWSIGRGGSPILTQSLGTMECKISDHKKTSTHTIFFGEIISGSANKEKSPLVYIQGSYTTIDTRLPLVGEPE